MLSTEWGVQALAFNRALSHAMPADVEAKTMCGHFGRDNIEMPITIERITEARKPAPSNTTAEATIRVSLFFSIAANALRVGPSGGVA